MCSHFRLVPIAEVVPSWLQRRRFEREAMAKGTTLDNVPGMLDTALRLAAATAVAIAVGLALRSRRSNCNTSRHIVRGRARHIPHPSSRFWRQRVSRGGEDGVTNKNPVTRVMSLPFQSLLALSTQDQTVRRRL